MRRWLLHLLKLAILSGIYVVTARIGLDVFAVSGFATVVWVPSGIALAALVLGGYRLWAGVAIGAFVANASAGAPVWAALGIAFGNTLEALVGAFLLLRFAKFRPTLDRARDVVALAVLAAGVSTVLSATIGVTVLSVTGKVAPGAMGWTWWTWWCGDLAGDLLAAPLLLTWSTTWRTLRTSPTQRTKWRIAEVLGLGLGLALFGTAIFFGWLPAAPTGVPLRPFFLFPLVIWAAVRFGPRGAASTNVVVSALAVIATLRGAGPFVGYPMPQSLFALYSFLAVSAFACLMIAAISFERAKEARTARESEMQKSAILDASLDAVVTMDEEGKVREFNAAAEALFGRRRDDAIGKELASLLIPARLRDGHGRGLAEYLDGGWQQVVGRRVSFPALGADGKEFSAELTIARVAGKGPPMFTAVVRDVTLQKETERALRRSHEELEEKVRARTLALEEVNVGLKRSEEQLREAQSLAHLGSFEWDLPTDSVLWSEELRRIFGVDGTVATTYEGLLKGIHPDDRERVRTLVEAGVSAQGSFGFQERIVRPDGAVRILDSLARVECDALRRPIRVHGTCRDTTDQTKAEEARSRLAAIVESSGDAIISMTPDGIIESWNQSAQKMSGYAGEDVVGRPLAFLMPEEKRGEIEDIIARARRGERPATFATLERRKDGSCFDASVTMSPIADPSGCVIGISTISRDITESTRAETKLRRFVAAAPDAIVIVDGAGKIVSANSQTERVFGYSSMEILGKSVDLLVPKRLRGAHEKHRAEYARQPKVRPMGSGRELLGLRKDGTEFPVEISLAPIEVEEIILVAAAIRDITERKILDTRLRESLEEKDILLREIHHRVKNNLQVIASLLDLQSATVASDEARHGFEESQRRIHSIALVHELLYKSKDLQRIDFREYLSGLVARLVSSYGLRPENVTVSVSAPDLPLDVDTAVPCGLIVNELVSNSLKHAFPKGRRGSLEVSVHRRGQKDLVLSVRDDGVGMRGDLNGEQPRSLGLQIVRSLTKQLRGTVEVASDDGTTVSLTFPYAASSHQDRR
jgi:PAS domain S-box-containing protein